MTKSLTKWKIEVQFLVSFSVACNNNIYKKGWLQSKYVLSMDWNFFIIHETCYASRCFISNPIQTGNNDGCTCKILRYFE